MTDREPPGEFGMSSEEILERLKLYQSFGILNYVLPTIPLGEQWVLGIDGLPIAKFKGNGDVICFIVGMETAFKFMAKKQGLVPDGV